MQFRAKYEVWFIPMVNPDGVVCGNYRSNLQGKDMNRHFFADTDTDNHKSRSYEVEILREKLRKKFGNNPNRDFRMFLDVHAHSTLSSIFIYAPLADEMSVSDQNYVQ